MSALTGMTEPAHLVSLFTVGAVTWATFFGSPLAGGFLLAANFVRYGEPRRARRVLLLSIALTIATFALAFLLPAEWKVPSASIYMPSLFATNRLAEQEQGTLLRSHRAAGGAFYSAWRAVGIGLATAVFVILVIAFISVLAGTSP